MDNLEPELNPRHQLAKLPDHIKAIVVGHLDIASRLTFRKTSKQFRQFVDTASYQIRKFTFEYGLQYIEISTSDGFKVRYEAIGAYQEEKCLLKYGNREKLIEEMSSWDCVYTDLSTLFKNKNLQIDTFYCNIIDEDENVDMSWRILVVGDLLTNLLQDLAQKLKVRNLVMKSPIIGYLDHIMPHLDPTFIKNVSITYHDEDVIIENDYEEKEFWESEVWMNVETFYTERFMEQIQRFPSIFSHLEYAQFTLFEEPTIEQVMQMKENLLENPNLRQIKINAKLKLEDFVAINNELRTYNMVGQANPSWAHFNYPNSINKRLSVCVTDTMIWFKGPCYVEGQIEEVHSVLEGIDDEVLEVHEEVPEENPENQEAIDPNLVFYYQYMYQQYLNFYFQFTLQYYYWIGIL